MTCYHPMPARQDGAGGKVVIWPPYGEATMLLPCGTCLGCRTDRALDWSRRCMHEARMYQMNSFVTLTYSEEYVPDELIPEDLTRFVKRLRQAVVRRSGDFERDCGAGVRYFACGEYGELGGRPHYHALLFNVGFRDRKACGETEFTSDTLTELWPFGNHTIGTVTPRSASYVAQYTIKARAWDADGVVRFPPFVRMSRKPALGSGFVREFGGDLREGYLVTAGRKGRIPRAYLKRLKEDDPSLYEEVEFKRSLRRLAVGAVDPARLEDAERIHKARRELLGKRKL